MTTLACLIKVSDVIPYQKNVKIHDAAQVKKISKSIEKYGFIQPLVIDRFNNLVIGHGRLEAAKKLQLESLPAIRLADDLTPTQINALRLIDNKIQNESLWDFVNLREEIAEITKNDFSLEEYITLDFAWLDESKEKMKELVSELEKERTAGEKAKFTIVDGDLIELGNHRVLCGDARSAESIKKVLQGNAIKLMVTDPPYGIEYDPLKRIEAKGQSLPRTKKLGKVLNDDIADWGDVYALWGTDVIYTWYAGNKSAEVACALRDEDYEIKSQIIWVKSNFALGRELYHWQHEPCFFAVKNGAKTHWTKRRDQSTVWQIYEREDNGYGHGTQKPLECMLRPILNHTIPGDIVADPFLGSGTTLIAADRTERRCFGTELNPDYCNIIITRWAAERLEKGESTMFKINGVEMDAAADEVKEN